MTFKPIARGPQTGAPPSLEFIALDRLQVDPADQRATDGPYSRRIIRGMVQEWKWALCQPLVVARREDGSLWILDGQHRHAGAKERCDIAHLPCVVLPAIGAAEEARSFVELNTRRQRLSQADIFHGMLAAGDADAKAAAELLEETGWRIVRSDNTQGFRPGDLTCAPRVVALLKTHGSGAVRNALTVLRQAYTDEAVTAPARLIEALVRIFRADGRYEVEPARLIAAMKPIAAGAWLPRAGRRRTERPHESQVLALSIVLLQAAGLARDPSAPIGFAVPKNPSAQPIPGAIRDELFTLEGGKAFCSQCDRSVTAGVARNCLSRFCKLKAEAA